LTAFSPYINFAQILFRQRPEKPEKTKPKPKHMKQILSLLMFLILALPLNATTQNIQMMPLTPENPVRNPGDKRVPTRKPIVTITDGIILKVDCVPEDTEIEIEILENDATLFVEYAQSHEILLPQLPKCVTYTLLLTVNDHVWIGTFSHDIY
jgi:hypothetical protein